MRKRPFVLLACMFLTGILVEKTGLIPIVGIGLLVYLYATPWKERGIRLWVLAVGMPLIFIMGMLRMGGQQSFRDRYLTQIEDGQFVRLAGKIDCVEEKPHCFYYYLTECSIDLSGKQMPCNDVLAYVSSDDYSVGQILVLNGTISLFDKATNEGQFDSESYYRSLKIDFGVWVNEVQRVHGKANGYRMFLCELRERLCAPFERYAEDDGILSAMLLGNKDDLNSEIKLLYQQSGIAHVLAISGLHISLLGMTLYRLLRHRCGFTYLWSGIIVVGFLVSYTIMSGNTVSARRATGMLIVYLAADLLGRAYDMLSALGAIMIFLLWDNPFLVENTGFWFTVLAVVGIGIGQEIVAETIRLKYLDEKKPMKRRVRWLQSFGVSVSIHLFTLPLVAYSYYEVPVYAILLNIPILALVPYILGLAVIGSLSGQIMLSQPLSVLACRACSVMLRGYQWICNMSLQLPGARLITGKPSIVRVVLYYGGLMVFICFLWWRMKRRVLPESVNKGALKRTVGYVLYSFLLMMVLLGGRRKEFELDVLDVGQGDAIYLCTPDGISLMMDGGSSDVKKVGTYRILPFLKAKAIRKVNYWFVSHTDEDHISGLVEVMESGYTIDTLVFAEAQIEDANTCRLATMAKQCSIRVMYMKAGDFLQTKDARVDCLYPKAYSDRKDINDRCLVLRYEDARFSGFFGGDISSEVEEELVQVTECERVDFLKGIHHGSKKSNSEVLLEKLAPRIAIISAGRGNSYGHPHQETLGRLQEAGTTVYRTDENGAIEVRIERDKIKILVYGDGL